MRPPSARQSLAMSALRRRPWKSRTRSALRARASLSPSAGIRAQPARPRNSPRGKMNDLIDVRIAVEQRRPLGIDQPARAAPAGQRRLDERHGGERVDDVAERTRLDDEDRRGIRVADFGDWTSSRADPDPWNRLQIAPISRAPAGPRAAAAGRRRRSCPARSRCRTRGGAVRRAACPGSRGRRPRASRRRAAGRRCRS